MLALVLVPAAGARTEGPLQPQQEQGRERGRQRVMILPQEQMKEAGAAAMAKVEWSDLRQRRGND